MWRAAIILTCYHCHQWSHCHLQNPQTRQLLFPLEKTTISFSLSLILVRYGSTASPICPTQSPLAIATILLFGIRRVFILGEIRLMPMFQIHCGCVAYLFMFVSDTRSIQRTRSVPKKSQIGSSHRIGTVLQAEVHYSFHFYYYYIHQCFVTTQYT
jgi:hypothetical protein